MVPPIGRPSFIPPFPLVDNINELSTTEHQNRKAKKESREGEREEERRAQVQWLLPGQLQTPFGSPLYPPCSQPVRLSGA